MEHCVVRNFKSKLVFFSQKVMIRQKFLLLSSQIYQFLKNIGLECNFRLKVEKQSLLTLAWHPNRHLSQGLEYGHYTEELDVQALGGDIVYVTLDKCPNRCSKAVFGLSPEENEPKKSWFCTQVTLQFCLQPNLFLWNSKNV